MAKRKRNDLSDGKKQIIAGLLNEYLGYERGQRSESLNARSGYRNKKVRGHYGELNLSVPQDRESSFESKIVPKRQKNITN